MQENKKITHSCIKMTENITKVHGINGEEDRLRNEPSLDHKNQQGTGHGDM